MIIVAFFLAALASICPRRGPGTDPVAGVRLGVRVGVVGDGSQAALRHMCWAVTWSAGIVATAGSHCWKKKQRGTEDGKNYCLERARISEVRPSRTKVDSYPGSRCEFSTLLNCTFS